MPVRLALGFPTIFNLLGPLTNPAGARRQLMGVYGRAFLEPIAAALADLGVVRAIVVHSDDGLDEVSITAPSTLMHVRGSAVDTERFDPGTLGLGQTTLAELTAADLDHATSIVRGVIEADDEDAEPLAALDAAAREEQGSVLVEVHDPGRTRSERGGMLRRTILPEQGEPDEDWELDEEVFHASRVRIEGPGWDHLPVEVVFRFADGVTLRENWDGRSDYRLYRFVRAAPLSEVRIDPQGINLLDPDPANNARLREPDDAISRDWSRWLGGVGQLLLEGLGQWL